MKYPKHYKKLTNQEQAVIFAGDAEFPVGKSYLNKTNCKAKAKKLKSSGDVTGMTELAIAQEIYAHAFCYYAATTLINAGISASIVKQIQAMGADIYIADGGDTAVRRAAYVLIWSITEPIVL